MVSVLTRSAALAAFLVGVAEVDAQAIQGPVLSQTITEQSLSLRYEIEAAETAVDLCEANHLHAVVVIVDSRGNTKLQMVGDQGNHNFLEEARRKARTAVMMRRSTGALKEALSANPSMRIPPDLDFLVVPGGIPFRTGSEVVGAIGVAGGEPALADQCAKAGINKLSPYLLPDESGEPQLNSPPSGARR
jgi:uncharacterized protein GlcG (DUF336 family)